MTVDINKAIYGRKYVHLLENHKRTFAGTEKSNCSCANCQNSSEFTDSQISSRIWVPNGSSVQQEGNSLVINPSIGYVYIGQTIEGQFERVTGGEPIKITCTCLDAGECVPFYGTGPTGNAYGCAHVGCRECKSKVTGGRFQFENGGFVNLSKEFSLDSTNGITGPTIFNAMFYQTEILADVQRFVQNNCQIYSPSVRWTTNSSLEVSGEYSFAFVNIYGRFAVMPLPDSLLLVYGIPPRKKKVTCSCGGGGGTCTLEENGAFGVKLYTCRSSGCNACTLTVEGGRLGNDFQVAACYDY